MCAKITRFLRSDPNNKMKDKLIQQRKELSSAYGISRFYFDEEHYQQWEILLNDSKRLMDKVSKTKKQQERLWISVIRGDNNGITF